VGVETVLFGFVGGLQVLFGTEVGVVATAVFENVGVYGGGETGGVGDVTGSTSMSLLMVSAMVNV
jgi:hypothetical protein